MLKKRKFWIAGIVLAIAMGSLIASNLAGDYFLEVRELKAQAASPAKQVKTSEQAITPTPANIRVRGFVLASPIQWDAQTRTTKFTIRDEKTEDNLSVIYYGTVPDAFKVDTEVVVRGKLNPQGIFEANELQAKCASKYTPKL